MSLSPTAATVLPRDPLNAHRQESAASALTPSGPVHRSIETQSSSRFGSAAHESPRNLFIARRRSRSSSLVPQSPTNRSRNSMRWFASKDSSNGSASAAPGSEEPASQASAVSRPMRGASRPQLRSIQSDASDCFASAPNHPRKRMSTLAPTIGVGLPPEGRRSNLSMYSGVSRFADMGLHADEIDDVRGSEVGIAGGEGDVACPQHDAAMCMNRPACRVRRPPPPCS